MKVPNDLRALAAEAFTEAISWPVFLAEHHDTIVLAEPYNAGRFHRLVELVRSVVVSGSTSGMFGAGDLADARAEWFDDDAQPMTQGTFLDTSEAYQ